MRNPPILILIIATLFFLAGCDSSVAPDGNGTGNDNGEQLEDDPYDPEIPDDYSDIAHINNFHLWGHYNVHDPTIIRHDGWYYIYSTDVFFGGGGVDEDDPRRDPKIPIRRSEDLVNWEPIGYVFDEMPEDVVAFLQEQQPTYRPLGVWAPFILEVDDHFRLYYSVPANNGLQTAWLGFATSSHPEGPWENEGLVLPTYDGSEYNGIDPAVVIDRENGRHWLIYGSWWNGISAVELDPVTGFRLDEQDLGKVIAARPPDMNGSSAMEGAEVLYHPGFDKYYLFVSYDWLMEPYNIRVGRADQPQGPYYDMFGEDMANPTDNYPKITAQYRFNNHYGWKGVGHSGLLRDGDDYYLVSQGRLGGPDPNQHLMVMHLRKMIWTDDGWPAVSPQRYAGIPQEEISEEDIIGQWEQITLNETFVKNDSRLLTLEADGGIPEFSGGSWSLNGTTLMITPDYTGSFETEVMQAWDWENGRRTLVFTGINEDGIGEWGKKIN